MTRGNPRPGQQQMPDRSDDVERAAQKIKPATTKATGEIPQEAAEVLREAREAAREAGRKAAKELGRVPKRAAKATK